MEDDVFYNSLYRILDKISSTVFLSQIVQFEMLKCTKMISEENTVQKRAKFELFLENIVKEADDLNEKLLKI